ncbi:hypothetical protein H0264_31255 [Nocardia huaxiensis]|uniref:Transcriptional regulator, AbiEi antitoxin, Type IV TA system n=1 Tax=Nocardia huaxiensis TaxID=2755382 RepID=A0A7D6V7N7_9NOCA|nr:hypothetical protein H0264_31255 [Nocardia huaxiensis]
MSVGFNPTEVTVTTRTTARVPAELLRRPLRVLRPRDAAGIYAHPRPEFARLARAGALHRLATGYYAAVPDDRIGQSWLPELEPTALGIAASDEGIETVALMGLSAARIYGALPRAVGVAVVAAHRHRPILHLADRKATVLFVRRDVQVLDIQRHSWELGTGWVTTIEQTILDLAARPELGRLPDAAREAARALLPRADRDLLADLAARQRRKPTLDRLLGATSNG